MTTLLKTGLIPAGLLMLTLVSCNDDNGPAFTGHGRIQPQVSVDATIVQARASRAADAITADQLTIALTSADGSYSEAWTGVSAFPADRKFPAGEYTMTADYGSVEDEGFDKPCYHGSAEVKVIDGQTATPTLTATLANSMVSVSYTDAFRNYMTDWSSQVHVAGGAYIDMAKDESRAAYVRPGAAVVNVSFTKPNGTSATLQALAFTAVARHHYKVTVDVNGGQVGDAVLSVSFDDSTVGETVDIELSDDLLTSPAPTLTAVGFTAGQQYTFNAGNTPDLSPKFNALARAGLGAVVMTTRSQSLLAKGWPAEIDLLTATPQQQAQLTALGFKGMGLWRNPDKMAAVDLTGMLSHIDFIPGADNLTEVTLSVRDRFGKVSEPLTLSVKLEIPFWLTCNPAEVYTDRATLGIQGRDQSAESLASRAELYLSVNGGEFRPAAVKADGALWRLSSLTPGTRYSARVVIDGVASIPVEFTTEATLQIPNGDFEQAVSHDGNASNWENVVVPGWGTNNPMTTGVGANYAYCRISGTKATSDAHGGSQAMRVSTQGWGGGNTAIGSVNGVCNFIDAGLLHLGASRTSRPEGFTGVSGPLHTDDLQCGIAFGSRPRALNFWYKYEPKNGADHGVAIVRVLDAQNRVIAQGSLELGAQGSYVQRTVSLNYGTAPAKAARLHVAFMSTNVPDALTKNKNWLNAPNFANTSRGEYSGSRLFIDDVTLTY